MIEKKLIGYAISSPDAEGFVLITDNPPLEKNTNSEKLYTLDSCELEKIIQNQYQLCLLIENLPASEQQTEIIIKASEILKNLKEINENY